MAAPDHMAGINNLPRWDASNPTTYRYDPKNYNAADYAQFKQARLDQQTKQQAATRARSKQIAKEVNQTIKDAIKGGKKEANNKKGASRDQIKQWAKAGHVLYADVPSDCFQELKFIPDKDDPSTGEVVGTFWHGGSLTYSGPLDLDEFLDATSGSLGEWYNATLPF